MRACRLTQRTHMRTPTYPLQSDKSGVVWLAEHRMNGCTASKEATHFTSTEHILQALSLTLSQHFSLLFLLTFSMSIFIPSILFYLITLLPFFFFFFIFFFFQSIPIRPVPTPCPTPKKRSTMGQKTPKCSICRMLTNQ